jgi:hypothetical protein
MLFLVQSSVWGSEYLERSAEILCIVVCLLLRGSSRRRAALCSVRGIPYQSAGQGVSTHLLSCDQQSFVWSSTALPTGHDDLLNSVSIEVRSLWLIVLAQC